MGAAPHAGAAALLARVPQLAELVAARGHSRAAAGAAGAAAAAAAAARPGAAPAALPPIVLASSSPFRRQVLSHAGVKLAGTVAPAIDERAIRRDTPEELVRALAAAKADAAAAKAADALGRERCEQLAAQGALLVACDQVVVCGAAGGREVLEKPLDEAEARAMIGRYEREPPSTVGSVAVQRLGADDGPRACGVSVATIHFGALPADSVDALVASGDVFKCAGGLMCEHELVWPHVARLEGDLDSVMGMPVRLLAELIDELDHA